MKYPFNIVARSIDGMPIACHTIMADDRPAAYRLATAYARYHHMAADIMGKQPDDMAAVSYQCYHAIRYNGHISESGVMIAAIDIARVTAGNHCRWGGHAPAVDDFSTKQATAKQSISIEQHNQYKSVTISPAVKAEAKVRRMSNSANANAVNHYEALRSELTAAYYRAMERGDDAASIDVMTASLSQDAREMISEAKHGLLVGLARKQRVYDCYTLGYRALNQWIGDQRNASEREMSIEYIHDGGGELVAWNKAVAYILRGDEQWTAAADGAGTMDEAMAKRLGEALAASYGVLNPTQRKIAELLGDGYSIQQIADALGRTHSTISGHVVNIRKALADKLGEGEFAGLLHEAQIAACFGKKVARQACHKRSPEAAARKAASDKATQAERTRAYRARKKAEAAKAAK